MKKFLKIGVMLMLFTSSAGWSQERSKEEERLEYLVGITGRISGRNIHDTLYSLPPEDIQLLIKHYRQKLEEVTKLQEASRLDRRQRSSISFQTEIPEIRRGLCLLGDPEQIQPLVDELNAGPVVVIGSRAASLLKDAARPEVIVQLAPAIFIDEKLEIKDSGGDVGSGTMSKSFAIAALIAKIVNRSPAFSGETRTWAEGASKALSSENPDQYISMMRRWWKENEQDFVKGDYKAVNVGEDLWTPQVKESKERRERAMAKLANWAKTATPSPEPEAAPAPVAKPIVKPVANTSDTPIGYAIIGVILLFFVSGLWIYGRSARQK